MNFNFYKKKILITSKLQSSHVWRKFQKPKFTVLEFHLFDENKNIETLQVCSLYKRNQNTNVHGLSSISTNSGGFLVQHILF